MLSELEFSMKKIHIARNMGLTPKNNDTSGKQNNGSAWDTGEPSSLGTCVTLCSDNNASLPLDCTLHGHEGTFMPEHIKRFLLNINHIDNNSIHSEDDMEYRTTERNYKDLELIAGAVTDSTTGVNSKSLMDSEVLLLNTEPSGANRPENSDDPEINNFLTESGINIQHTMDEDISCGERGKLVGVCRVCGDHATGMYFGALVCVPCKTFFLRYASDGNSFVCKADGNCQISTATRTQCKFCRYQKCVQAGMRRRVRPAQVKLNEGQQLCVVCSDVGNGVHFGALTCEGCKKFFRRGLSENAQYVCKSGNNCVINPQTRNSCRYCRYQKCLQAGMCREAIQMGRPSKIPSNNGTRNSTDRHNLHRPVNRTADSSSKGDDIASLERIQVESLSQSLNLLPPESWLNRAMFSQSFLNWKNGRSLSLSSDESQLDLENSKEPIRKHDLPTLHPTSSNSDLTQQPDSTVLSPADMGHLDELDEPFLSPDNPTVPKALWTKGPPALLSGEIRASLGRRVNTFVEDKEQSVEKRKRTSLTLESEGSPSGVPERLPMRLHNGAKTSRNSSLDLTLEVKQQKMSWTPNSQGSTGSSTMLPLLKENGLNVGNTHTQGFVESTTVGQADGSCSSPSITSSLSCDTFQKKKNEDELINLSGNQLMKNEDLTANNSFSKKFDLESLVAKSRTYWLQPCLPDPNILFAGAKHWDVLNSIVPTYDRFLQMSNAINRTLKAEFEEWSRQVTDPMDNQTFLSEWIKHKVIPAYTIASVTYCKSLPGFSSFHCDDQRTIIRLGQSPSRILMAALNWYDADQKNFRNFLSWRDRKVGQLDLFKQKLIEYAEDISSLEVDAIEAALLNVLLILATDYPALVRADVINDARWKILSTFRAYTTGKCGTPNNRVESLFSHIPELRRLGLLHHMMMTTRTMTAEEVEYLTSGRTLDSKMVLSCQPTTTDS